MSHDIRQTDHDQTAEIERMISDEPDPRVRVQLLMMHKLTSAVSEIGVNVADLDKKFTKHSVDEAALVNQIKGGWKVAAWVFGIAQVVVVWAYLDIHAQVKDLGEKYHEDVIQHERMEGRIKNIENVLKVGK